MSWLLLFDELMENFRLLSVQFLSELIEGVSMLHHLIYPDNDDRISSEI